MTNRTGSSSARRLACTKCGTEFGCDPAGGCWCAKEDFRLPMPSDGGDCLCPACLRALAEQQKSVSVT